MRGVVLSVGEWEGWGIKGEGKGNNVWGERTRLEKFGGIKSRGGFMRIHFKSTNGFRCRLV